MSRITNLLEMSKNEAIDKLEKFYDNWSNSYAGDYVLDVIRDASDENVLYSITHNREIIKKEMKDLTGEALDSMNVLLKVLDDIERNI